MTYRRMICWPRYTLECLAGRCSYCPHGRMILLDTIKRKIDRDDVLTERAWRYGLHSPNVVWKDGVRPEEA